MNRYAPEDDACYEMGAAEAYDRAVHEVIMQSRALLDLKLLPPCFQESFKQSIDNLIEFYEHTDDPRANGWVGQDGRP